MAVVEAVAVTELLKEVDSLSRAIETAGSRGRARLQNLEVDRLKAAFPLNLQGDVDDAAWGKLGEEKQEELQDRLRHAREALHAAKGLDGPIDPRHLMYDKHASTAAVISWTIVSFALCITLLFAVTQRWERSNRPYAVELDTARAAIARLDAATDSLNRVADSLRRASPRTSTPRDSAVPRAPAGRNLAQAPGSAGVQADTVSSPLVAAQRRVDSLQNTAGEVAIRALKAMNGGANERQVLFMVILLGGLGGAVHLAASLVRYIGNRNLKRSWLPYYLSLPFVGAGLAPIVYLLLRVGILTPTATENGKSATEGLNLVGIYAFAALTGMFATIATDKLREVFKAVFQTQSRDKDPVGGEKPGGEKKD